MSPANSFTVIAAFEDAIKLVQRIRDQRERTASKPLPDEPTRDLLDSLALGPAIVRGHYEHDLKRFGEQYACGDIQAREQMKDILINLQMTLITTLRMVYMDDMDLNFGALQICSDDCRVNAGVCLGQLSQRLSEAAKAQAHYPVSVSYSSGSGLMPPMSPSLGYSSSRSTHSSAAFQAPRTPEMMTEQFNNLSMSPQVRPPYLERTMSASSGGSQDLYAREPMPTLKARLNAPTAGEHKIERPDLVSMRRRSSQTLAPDDNILLLFPQPGGQPIKVGKPAKEDLQNGASLYSARNSQPHSRDVSRASSGHQSQNSRERYGPDDYGDGTRQYSHGTIYDMYQPPTPERQASTSHPQRVQSPNRNSPEHVRYLQDNSRPPRPQPPRTDSLNAPRQREQLYNHRTARLQTISPFPPPQPPQTRSYTATPDQFEYSGGNRGPPNVPLPAPPPSQPQLQALPPIQPQPSLSQLLSPSSNSAASIHTAASSAPSVSLPVVPTGPLILPTDKALLGFCKGAFRLQAGLERKAFSVANRPSGFSGMISYWRCEKCNFEGPVHNSVNTSDGKKKGKPERTFDPKIRVSEGGGVRYKWAFLARCHVPLKGMVPVETRDGSFGSFGCIFCCAEGKNRGWLHSDKDKDNEPRPGSGSIKSSSNGSVRSGHTANTANTAAKVGNGGNNSNPTTPIFGNVASFMLHLESVHGSQEGWPNAEMLGRFRVVVGRLAGVHEDGWDVNFVPV